MADVTPVPIGPDRVTTGDEIVVRSPYDGSEVGRVPACDAGHVDQAVAAARALAEPLAAHARAAVLDRAADLLAARVEDFARIVAAEARPPQTARVEAGRAVETFRSTGRGPDARQVLASTCAGRRGKLAFALRSRSASALLNFPLNLVARVALATATTGCAQAGEPRRPLSALALASLLLDECGLPRAGSTWSRAAVGPSATPWSPTTAWR